MVHGGEPTTMNGLSSSMAFLARRRSSALKQFQDRPCSSSRRSSVDPGNRPSLGTELMAAVARGGENNSTTRCAASERERRPVNQNKFQDAGGLSPCLLWPLFEARVHHLLLRLLDSHFLVLARRSGLRAASWPSWPSWPPCLARHLLGAVGSAGGLRAPGDRVIDVVFGFSKTPIAISSHSRLQAGSTGR